MAPNDPHLLLSLRLAGPRAGQNEWVITSIIIRLQKTIASVLPEALLLPLMKPAAMLERPV